MGPRLSVACPCQYTKLGHMKIAILGGSPAASVRQPIIGDRFQTKPRDRETDSGYEFVDDAGRGRAGRQDRLVRLQGELGIITCPDLNRSQG